MTQAEIDEILAAIGEQNVSAEQVSEQLGLPLFKCRSRLRELVTLNLVVEENELYSLAENS